MAKTTNRALSATLLILLAPWIGADEADDESFEQASLPSHAEEVTVETTLPWIPTSASIATRLPVDLLWTPANVGVVDRVVMDAQGAESLGDALENVSGLGIQSESGLFDVFFIRGFDYLSSGLVLTDGAPDLEGARFSLYNIDRIEVFKGPAGFLYGSSPLAGAVNMVRKHPVQQSFVTANLEYGSFQTFGAQLDLNTGGSEVGFRLNGLWRETDGYRDGISSRTGAVNPTLRFKLGEKTSLHLNLEYGMDDSVPDSGLPLVNGELPPVPRDSSYGSPWDSSEQEAFRFQADLESILSPLVTLRNKTFYRRLAWDTTGTLPGPVIPDGMGGSLVIRSQLILDDLRATAGNQLEAVFSPLGGGVEHNLVAGLEVALSDDDYKLDVGLLPPMELVDPVETATQPIFILPDQSAAGDSTTTVVAPYLTDQIVFSDRFQMLVGTRLDFMGFEDQGSGSSRSFQELSALLGAVYSPAPGVSLYANGARSFAPPSPRLLDLEEPERSQQLELGTQMEILGGDLRTKLAVFHLERFNIAIPDDNGFTQQEGDQRSRGVELEISGEIKTGLQALLAYAYTDAVLTRFSERTLAGLYPPLWVTVDRSGNRPAFVPEHLAKLWVATRITSSLDLGLGARYVGPQYIAEDNVTELDGYLLLSMSAGYALGPWRLSLHLDNLTDQEYETRGFGSASVIPGEPFAWRVGVEYRY